MTRIDTTNPAWQQASYDVRFDWGPTGAAAVAADVTVVVDVLSFTTTLSVAVEGGIEVFPFGWRDVRATSYALTRDAVLAVGRSQAGPGEVSLSPLSVRAASGVERLVLPSPNGSSISFALATAGGEVLGGCLRNATAVGAVLAERVRAGASVAVVAAGERWPDGTLRPAVEDLWGAGAILAAIGAGTPSPEARLAVTAYDAVAAYVLAALRACASGRELVAAGHPGDVEVAGELDATNVVPALRGESFVAS
ncbi:2-phosphosulfolactate phosphatase [Nocardioides lianchengensis]|uniref:Probable 2-phosphosulfolactate phosphatase n=1 Tax=Nocardioides lianchengensis TaxID=1045774 RepID=A0A1G6LZM3_9ACTN|nr:2-phosphosulfolactate phosphatase [Nocardioides lianchengensis]NYG12396.1 2-phosphosulfolactate phosphatase [Nocardioides lianchengensis]SDC48723.1 2-phosphosulfolactate phosphatase [Nocardioides lianchengensis]